MANFTRLAIKKAAEAIIRSYPAVTAIVEYFDAVTACASHRKKAIMHICRPISREIFERNLMMECEYFVGSYVDTALAGESISPEDKQTIVAHYKCVCSGLTIDWLNGGMTEAYIRSIRRTFLLKKDLTMEIATLLQNQV